MAAIHAGALLFIVALALSTILEPSTWPLHMAQALIYAAIMAFCQRESVWGAGAGVLIAALWNGANLFATGFVASGLKAFAVLLRTHQVVHPAFQLVVVGALGHFLMLAGCLVLVLRSRPRRWARFAGGAVLGFVALLLIYPLRHHALPLPLDVSPSHDAIGHR